MEGSQAAYTRAYTWPHAQSATGVACWCRSEAKQIQQAPASPIRKRIWGLVLRGAASGGLLIASCHHFPFVYFFKSQLTKTHIYLHTQQPHSRRGGLLAPTRRCKARGAQRTRLPVLLDQRASLPCGGGAPGELSEGRRGRARVVERRRRALHAAALHAARRLGDHRRYRDQADGERHRGAAPLAVGKWGVRHHHDEAGVPHAERAERHVQLVRRDDVLQHKVVQPCAHRAEIPANGARCGEVLGEIDERFSSARGETRSVRFPVHPAETPTLLVRVGVPRSTIIAQEHRREDDLLQP